MSRFATVVRLLGGDDAFHAARSAIITAGHLSELWLIEESGSEPSWWETADSYFLRSSGRYDDELTDDP